MIRSGLIAVLALGALASTFPTGAQTFPSRTVKFVMPAAPGSSPDRVSRLLALQLGMRWAVPVIVENRPGGTGTVGSEYVMRSAPDGYTSLFAFTSVIQAPALLPKVPYDIEKDFVPVSLVAYAPVTLSVRADSPFKTLADLLAAAKDPAAPLSYGTFGAGSTFHIYGETLRRAANAQMVMVPYKGEALALTDLLGGQIQSTWASLGLVSPHIAAGRVRALAIAQTTRSKVAPEVPTFAELGYPQVGVVTWFGVLLPMGTPHVIVQKMSADINGVLAQPEVSNSLTRTGIEPAGTTPERFAEVLKVDSVKWREMIKEAGITAGN